MTDSSKNKVSFSKIDSQLDTWIDMQVYKQIDIKVDKQRNRDREGLAKRERTITREEARQKKEREKD